MALVYYCNYVLGSYNDGITQTMVFVIGGIPMVIKYDKIPMKYSAYEITNELKEKLGLD